MNRGSILLVPALLALAAPRAAASQAVEKILWSSPTQPALRARLFAFVATAPESAVAGKGAALYYAGRSFERAGKADSARILFERAVAVRGLAPERDALVDALLDHGDAEQARRALEVLGPRFDEALRNTGPDLAVTRGRRAWALYVTGQGDSALQLMRTEERWLLDERNSRHRDWRYRLALLELEHGNPMRSLQLVAPLAVASRFQDRDVMGIIQDAIRRQSADATGFAARLQQELRGFDRGEQMLLDTLRARRLDFRGKDGSPVSGIAFPAAGPRARAVVGILGPDELFETYDSLAAGLRRAGYSLLLIEPRGSGRSVTPQCPLPETWRGRETEMHQRVARDVLAGLRALAAMTSVDTTRYLVTGAGSMASVAVEAASLDRRARPLVLFAPQPAAVDRGVMLARLRRSGAPVFYKIPVMDAESMPVAEALYAIDPRRSRIAESEHVGQGAAVFRRDRTALPRLLQWLDESWMPASARSGSRP